MKHSGSFSTDQGGGKRRSGNVYVAVAISECFGLHDRSLAGPGHNIQGPQARVDCLGSMLAAMRRASRASWPGGWGVGGMGCIETESFDGRRRHELLSEKPVCRVEATSTAWRC
jgi:hypothetical protein